MAEKVVVAAAMAVMAMVAVEVAVWGDGWISRFHSACG